MGLIVSKFNHIGNDVKNVYVSLNTILIQKQVEEREIPADDGDDVVIARFKEWKRVAIFFVYMSQAAALNDLEPISSYKVVFSLDDFYERDCIDIKALYEQLVDENFKGVEVTHV